jgi:hypothetical protein
VKQNRGWRLDNGTGEWELTLGSRWSFTLVALGSFFTLTKRIMNFYFFQKINSFINFEIIIFVSIIYYNIVI